MVHNALVSTPSERLWARRAEWDDAAPLPVSRAASGVTLAATADRVAGGTELRAAAADFLDDLQWADDDAAIADRIGSEPRFVDPHTDAYLGALAEHIAGIHSLAVPYWAVAAHRFLDHFWWPSRTVGLYARAVVESPAAFRRRGIFIGRSTLRRV